MTPEQAQALDIARALTYAGIPVFVAPPDPSSNTGYALPTGWQHTRPDPRVVDAWQPGMALAMVMGHGLDLLDVDLHKGGDPSALNGSTPTSYAAAVTPSGGMHSFIRSLGVRSRDAVLPGVDVKAGEPDGTGRGFAFIAPTVRTSKATGQPSTYRWITTPDLSRLSAALRGEIPDDSGQLLRALIEAARAPRADTAAYTGPDFDDMDEAMQSVVRQWVAGAISGIQADLTAAAAWAPGQTDERGRGWEKLTADSAMRLGQLARARWNDLDLVEAETILTAAAPVDGTWGTDDVALKWTQQHHRGEPAGWPDLRTAADRDAEAWANLGLTPTAAPPTPPGHAPDAAATPEVGGAQPLGEAEIAQRYFGPGGIQAATLAGDTLALGPLRQGIDHIMWSYDAGVWGPDKKVVEARLARMLGQRFRTAYVGTVEAVVRAHVDTIDCAPIPGLINFTNGLLDWRTGELHPHTPDLPTTVQMGVDYDPDAQCPTFESFVAQVVPDDVVDTVWELIGYLMYSGNPLHKAVMLTGTGRNGKGTFLRVLQSVLGPRNITSVSLHDLINTRFTTASLFGKLANIAGDIDAGYLENTAVFKGITGGDTISAEHKGRDRFDFNPWAVPLFSANKIPPSADTTDGYLARWLIINFPNSFLGREDRHLDAKLADPAELRGVAARGVAALAPLLERGDFMPTASGEAAREEFIRRVDQVRTWVADCCSIDPEHPMVPRTELYGAYKQWAFRDGHKPVRASEFYERITQAGAEPVVVHGTRGFKRIRVHDHGLTPAPGTFTVPAPPAPDVTPTTPGTPEPSVEATPAPTQGQGVSAGQPHNFRGEGAEGADTAQPPYTRVRPHVCIGGVGSTCTLCTQTIEAPATEKPARPKTAAKPKSAAATAKAAEAKAAKRQAAIDEASGAYIDLPAVVLRDGTVRHLAADEADQLLATIDELTVDVETTGFPVGHPDYALRTVQLGDERFAVDFDPDDADSRPVIRRHLARATTLHAHSATADLVPLEVAGLLEHGYDEAWSRMEDTVIAAKLADPASTGSDPSLKKLAAAVLGDYAVSPAAEAARAALFKAGRWLSKTEVTTGVERSGWAQVDPHAETMIRYAASDVLDDAAIARQLPKPPPAIAEREQLAQTMTARVALTGLRLDGDHVANLRDQQQADLADAAGRLRDFGIENPGSDVQVGAAVERLGLSLPRTGTGRPSVAKGVLEPYRAAEGDLGALVRARLDYQVAENRLGLFLDGYHLATTQGDGRVRPTVYTMEAKTGRMSCVRPNLQQVPREGGFRACITADPGQVLISADFASVELRVAAALSGDTELAAIVNDPDRDIHAEIARLVWGPTAGKAERYQAKRKVFGRLYGSGINGLVTADPPVPEHVARAIVHAMDQMTPGLTAWSRSVADGVEAGRTKFQTHSGRIVHLPVDRGYAAPNYCIQGTARELLIDALVQWRKTRWGNATLLPVHDELLVAVPEDDAEEATSVLVECMATQLAGIPIVAEASAPSYAWADSA